MNTIKSVRTSKNNKVSGKNKESQEIKPEKMAPLMKAIKAVRSVNEISEETTAEGFSRQRSAQEFLSKLVTPPIGVTYEKAGQGEINAEWASPDYTHVGKTVILYCHGGGYTSGGLGYAGILAGKLALHTGLSVFYFEYRLAPENPYPAAIEDGMKAWDSLMYMGYGAENVIIAGDSAGGNMALEIVLKLKEEGRFLPKALVLMSPWTDMTASSPSYEKYKDLDPMLTREYVLGVRKAYAGNEADYSLPQYSPLYGELTNMPPTLIQVGSNEILRADSERLYRKLKHNECNVRLKVYNGGWHVFQLLPLHKASRALDDVRDFIWTLM
ncbi:MAG: alpha/beta hydrolase [Lachnospiraceae bacterium]|nr:alpha/beta hydrolase [Lachnospiraceae bacterium]